MPFSFLRTTDNILISSLILNKKKDLILKTLVDYLNFDIVITSAKTAICLYTILQVGRYVKGLRGAGEKIDERLVQPLFFPCRTSHVRMFPKKHGFAYSYLWVGIPVGWKGSIGGMISCDETKERLPFWKRWLGLGKGESWYQVNSDDYLDRGHEENGLRGKLDKYLESQDINPSLYPHAYLLTAAKFLNYASNPVSVWHLYSPSRELSALVLEVNNTFDERRMYFLEPSTSPPKPSSTIKPTRYTGTWKKDFYVSTFNSRAGAYSLAAYDPLYPSMTRTGPINTTITLSSAEGNAMLIARVYSNGEALDPSLMTTWHKTKFLAAWWWVGLMTFPRTIKEAFRLLVRRKMPWVFRPEPRSKTMARRADETELFVESHFRAWLQSLVEKSEEAMRIRYIPAGMIPSSSNEEIIIFSPSEKPSKEIKELEIRILTPLFYTRLIQYPTLHSALTGENNTNNTISISNSSLLSNLNLFSKISIPQTTSSGKFFKLISQFRKSPSAIPSLEDDEPIAADKLITMILDKKDKGGMTGFDEFILNNCGRRERWAYARRVGKLVLASYIALGSMELLDLEIFLGKVVFVWGVVKWLL